jgi:uncharacterized Zn finger protein
MSKYQGTSTCQRCEQVYPDEVFRKSDFSFSVYCWKCQQEIIQEKGLQELRQASLMRCIRCGELMPTKHFTNFKRRSFDWCKACRLKHLLRQRNGCPRVCLCLLD